MGQILKTKTSPQGKITLQLELTMEEAQRLKNHRKKVHLFSENLCTHETKFMERGVNHGAKSISIPLSLKSRKKTKILEIAYQKIENNGKIFFIAIGKKDLLS